MAALSQAIEEKQAAYVSAFARAEAGLARIGPHSLHNIRREAIERFHELGFPNIRSEEWRFTSLAGLTGIAFERATPGDRAHRADELVRLLPCRENRLVFVNGYYAPGLPTKAEGVILRSFGEAFRSDTFPLEQHLCHYADYRAHPFAALNTAFLEDGAFVRVAAGAVVETPIHLVHVATGGSGPRVCHSRNLVVLEEHSQATVIETYIGPAATPMDGNRYFTNAVTEIVGGEGAILDHYKVQVESDSAFHIATIQIQQGRGCVVRSHSFSFGAALARTELNAVLAEGSDSTLNGLSVAGGKQHVDTRTSIDHAKPHATSHELYKGILDQRSSAVFNGRIIVRKDAQKTDAKQTNKNLVLSEGATINTKPELQIHADDVRCTHGATIGQLDGDSLFYLRSRGIGHERAREILIAAFAQEIIDGIRAEPLRKYVEQTLASRLARKAK